MMAKILTKLINEDIDSRFARLAARFAIRSDVLDARSKRGRFLHDYESVPIIKGTSIRGGVIHDYLSRATAIRCNKKAGGKSLPGSDGLPRWPAGSRNDFRRHKPFHPALDQIRRRPSLARIFSST